MCASPPGHPMEWGALVGLKTAWLAEVVSSNAIRAFDLHHVGAHGTL
jgi:hypothetical protein